MKDKGVLKVDETLGLVFGFAVVSTIDGEPYYDTQGDYVTENAVMKAVAANNLPDAMDMHETPTEGRTVSLFPLTADVAKALDVETRYTGLAYCLKPSEDVLSKFVSGEYTGFSIGGRVLESRVEKSADTPGDGARRVIDELTIDEISAVVKPAQEPATLRLVKVDEQIGANMEEHASRWVRVYGDYVDVGRTASVTQSQEFRMDNETEAALGELTPEQFQYWQSRLDSEKRAAFLKMSSEERQKAVEPAYKSADGSSYFSSDDPRLIAQAKRADEQAELLAKAAADAMDRDRRERAEKLTALPGTVEERAALIGAVDGIADDEKRAAVLKTLAAANERMREDSVAIGKTADEDTEIDPFEALVRKFQTENADADESTATLRVLATPEGRKAWKQRKEA